MKANIRNDAPAIRVRNTDTPTFKIREKSFIQKQGTLIQGGTPIGLLLALTYANGFTVGNLSSFPGNVRIRTTD